MHFRMEQLPLTVPRLSEIAAALRRRPSLSPMPAFPCAGVFFVLFALSLSRAQTCWCSVHYSPTASLESNRQTNIHARVCSPTYTGLVSFYTSNNKCKCVYSHFHQSVLCHCRNTQLKPGEPGTRQERLQSQVTFFLSKMEKTRKPDELPAFKGGTCGAAVNIQHMLLHTKRAKGSTLCAPSHFYLPFQDRETQPLLSCLYFTRLIDF